MNAYVTELSATEVVRAPRGVSSRVEDFIRTTAFDRPTLVIDTQAVAEQYRALKAGLGRATIHYAVKANPDRAVIETLVGLGSHFDAASRGEIELCLSQGARPQDISSATRSNAPPTSPSRTRRASARSPWTPRRRCTRSPTTRPARRSTSA